MIDNAPTVCGNNPKWCESCVSKGKCASTRPQDEWTPQGEWAKGYHEGFNTGTMLAEAFNERPQGEWKLHGMIYYCSECGHECGESGDNFCGNCGAKMQK